MLLLLFLFALCDNIEMSADEFDIIYCGNTMIYSKDLKYANNIKISHSGEFRLQSLKLEPGVFLIYDRTVYFNKTKTPIRYRIDFERRVFGLPSFVWPLIGFCILVAIVSYNAIFLVFKYLDQEIKS